MVRPFLSPHTSGCEQLSQSRQLRTLFTLRSLERQEKPDHGFTVFIGRSLCHMDLNKEGMSLHRSVWGATPYGGVGPAAALYDKRIVPADALLLDDWHGRETNCTANLYEQCLYVFWDIFLLLPCNHTDYNCTAHFHEQNLYVLWNFVSILPWNHTDYNCISHSHGQNLYAF